MVSAAHMAMMHSTNAKHVRHGHGWSCCYCCLLVPLCLTTGFTYLWYLRKVAGPLAVLSENVPRGFLEVMKFKSLERDVENIKKTAELALNQCLQDQSNYECEGALPFLLDSNEGYDWLYVIQEYFDGDLRSIQQVTHDPYFAVEDLATLGSRLDAIEDTMPLLKRPSGRARPCGQVALHWCTIRQTAVEILRDNGQVDEAIQDFRSVPFLLSVDSYYSAGGLFTYAVILAVLVSAVCFHFFWSFDSSLSCNGGSRQGTLLYGGHIVFMLFVVAFLMCPVFIAADITFDMGLVTVGNLRTDVSLKVLILHVQENYAGFWNWLFRGELTDEDFSAYIHAATALIGYCLLLISFGVGVVIRMPYHGRLPTAEDIKQEVKGSWPNAPNEELLELDKLTSCQLLALGHVRRICRDLHQLAMPRLRQRVQQMGYSDRDLDRTLAWIREEAPIIVHIRLEEVSQKLRNDTHYRNQFETNRSGGTLDHRKRKRWEDDLFGGAYERASAFERVKYGSVNVINDPVGVRACAQYGSSYLLLKKCRLRTTFSAEDSAGLETKDLATVDYYAHVLMKYGDPELREVLQVATGQVFGVQSSVLGTYKEAQIHGEVSLADHIELIMAHPSLRLVNDHRAAVEALATRCNSQVVWIEGGIDLPPGSQVDSSLFEPDASGVGSYGPGIGRPRSPAGPTLSPSAKAAAAAAAGSAASSFDEHLVLVSGVTGWAADASNGAYIAPPRQTDGADKVFVKVGDPTVAILLEASEEGALRWRVAPLGQTTGDCYLRSGPLRGPTRGRPQDPAQGGSWFTQTSDGWERQNAKVLSRKVTPGTAERMETAGLPPGWDLAEDGAGSVYYFNWETRESLWSRPVGSQPEGQPSAGSSAASSSPSSMALQQQQQGAEVWEVEVDSGWTPLIGAAMIAIRSAVAAGQEVVEYESRGFKYVLNLSEKTQRNLSTGRTRRLQQSLPGGPVSRDPNP